MSIQHFVSRPCLLFTYDQTIPISPENFDIFSLPPCAFAICPLIKVIITESLIRYSKSTELYDLDQIRTHIQNETIRFPFKHADITFEFIILDQNKKEVK